VTDPTIPLSDLSAHLPALIAGRVTVNAEAYTGSLPWCLTGAHADAAADGSLFLSMLDSVACLKPDTLSLVLDPHTVRALAVVLAEAVGLDVSAGVLAWMEPWGIAVVRLTLQGVGGYRERYGRVHPGFSRNVVVPALADIDPAHPHALGLALAATLRVTPPRRTA